MPVFLLLLTLLGHTAVAADDASMGTAMKDANGDDVSGPPVQAVLGHATMDFAAALYNVLAAQPGNIAFAPYDIATTMLLTARGAKGPTYDQMVKVFRWPGDPAALAEAYKLLTGDLKPSGSDAEWRLVHQVWVDKGLGLKANAADAAVPALHLQSQSLDTGSAKVLGEAMTRWYHEQSVGRLTKVTAPEAPLLQTRAVVGNTMLFKGAWMHRLGGRKVARPGQVEMLTRKASINFTETPDYTAAEMELSSEHTNLLILIPKDPAARLDKSPDGAALREIINNLQPTDISVAVPTFRIAAHFDLTQALQTLGIQAAFKDPDFSNLFDKPVALADVQQQIYVSVDKVGTDVGSATYARFGKPHAKAAKAGKISRIERPFLFILRDTFWNVPLVFGRVEAL